MSVKIVTDSAADLQSNTAKDKGIEVLPILVYINNKEYLDGMTIKNDTLYQQMVAGAEVKTAQIPLAYFIDKFKNYAQTNDHYLYLAFSSKLSGTYQTAIIAKQTVIDEYPDLKLEIVDTKCVSLGLGLLVLEAADMAKSGASIDEVKQHVLTEARHMVHLFSVDNLEYLLKGGRVSRTQAFLGSVLNIKPILHVVDGALVPFDKAKGKKRRFDKICAYIDQYGYNLKDQQVGIAHVMNEQDAMMIKAYFKEKYNTKAFVINALGCAIGAHCGPGLITLFFKSKEIVN